MEIVSNDLKSPGVLQKCPPQFHQCASPVTDGILDGFTQFCKGTFVSVRDEKRIIAKTAGTGLMMTNASLARSFEELCVLCEQSPQ